MKKLLNLLFITIMTTSFIACSDLKKEEIQKAEISSREFEITCKLDISSLKNILTELVEDQINCLEQYLLLVSKVLTSDQPKSISRVEFKRLLSEGIDGLLDKVDGDIVSAIDAVFELNFLIGSGDKNFITKDQLKNLMRILRKFNIEVLPVYHEIANRRPVEYSWHKERRRENFQSTQRLVKPILESFVKKRDQIDKTDLHKILDVFSKGDENDIISKVKDFLILKKIVLGGQKDIITHNELYNLFQKAPAIVAVVYDVIQFSDINFKNALEKFDFANIALTNVGRDIIVKRRAGSGEIFTLRELEYYFKKLYSGTMKLDLFKAKKVVRLVKDIFFGEGDAFTGPQLRKFIALVRRLGSKMEYFLALYEANQDELDKVSAPFIPKLNNLKPKNKLEVGFRNEFKQMVNRYLYFKGDNISATFSRKTKRNAKAMLEHVVFESLSREVYSYWEKKHPCDSKEFPKDERCEKENLEGDLTLPQFKKLALVAENFLVDAKFIPEGSIEGVAGSMVLLADLLLKTSNSDVAINPYETAEFATILMSASNLGDILYERMRLTCSTNYKSEIEPECFKANFSKELFRKGDDVDISAFAPYFYQYVEDASNKSLLNMVNGALGYAQTCSHFRNGEAVYIDKGDMTIMLIGMLHLESLIVLYDDNQNNLLDTPEIKRMYDERFFSLIDMSVGTSPLVKFIIRDKNRYKVFLEIIKEQKAPKIWRVLGMKFEKISSFYSTAQRDKLNSVLGVLGGGGSEVDFDACEKLR